GHTATSANFTAADILSLVNIGADEPGKVSFNSAIDGVDSGIDSKGNNVLYKVIDATHIQGVDGARIIFTLTDNGNDTFTFTLNDQVDHLPLNAGGGDNELTSLALANVFVVTDFDGDSVIVDN